MLLSAPFYWFGRGHKPHAHLQDAAQGSGFLHCDWSRMSETPGMRPAATILVVRRGVSPHTRTVDAARAHTPCPGV
jgi:hypothetical protein